MRLQWKSMGPLRLYCQPPIPCLTEKRVLDQTLYLRIQAEGTYVLNLKYIASTVRISFYSTLNACLMVLTAY